MSVVGLEQQFDDIECFCASDDPTCGSVLGVDCCLGRGAKSSSLDGLY